MCEISCKNSERLLRKWQKTLGDTFFCRTLYASTVLSLSVRLSVRQFVTLVDYDKMSEHIVGFFSVLFSHQNCGKVLTCLKQQNYEYEKFAIFTNIVLTFTVIR